MPYRTNKELPDGVKNALPARAQTIWRNVFNSQQDQGLSEARSAASAWAALENQGWEKQDGGKWKLKKSEPEEFAIEAKISKVDEPQRLVFGWLSVVSKDGEPLTDLQEEVIDQYELEKAVYEFNLDFRDAGEMHEEIGVGKMVESVMLTDEKMNAMGIPAGTMDPGWWGGFKLDPERFQKVVSGEYKMFSIGGKAKRVSI